MAGGAAQALIPKLVFPRSIGGVIRGGDGAEDGPGFGFRENVLAPKPEPLTVVIYPRHFAG